MTKALVSAAIITNKIWVKPLTHILEAYDCKDKEKGICSEETADNFGQQGHLSEIFNMYPNLCTNYVLMAVIADIMSVYVLMTRGAIKILAFILSDKMIYYKRMCSRIMEIKWR